MKSDISVDYRFKDQQDAAEAIKVLQEAGFEEVEISEAVPESEAYSDIGQPPPQEMRHSLAKGALSGCLGGIVFALIMIEGPASIMETGHHGLFVFAAIFFGGVLGTGVGVWLALIWGKRIHLQNRLSVPLPREGFLLRVWVQNPEERQTAAGILSRFEARLPHPTI